MSVAIGMDVGGTSLRAALMDQAGVVVRSVKRPLAGRSPEDVLRQLTELVSALGPSSDAPIAVGIAAQLWVKRGIVAVAPAFGWYEVPMGPMLSERFGRQVRLVNDLDAITVGEAVRGAGAGNADVMCVFVGTGVGMGAVCHGRILEGTDGLATELGHIKVESPETGRLCGCGERGCLEAYTSGSHLPALLAAKVADGLTSRLLPASGGEAKPINSVTIEEAALAGDPAARALWADIALRLGRAIGNSITIINPAVLVLGGGVLRLAPSLREAVVQQIKLHAARPHLRNLRICDTELGDDAGLVGAGLLAHQSAGSLLRAAPVSEELE